MTKEAQIDHLRHVLSNIKEIRQTVPGLSAPTQRIKDVIEALETEQNKEHKRNATFCEAYNNTTPMELWG